MDKMSDIIYNLSHEQAPVVASNSPHIILSAGPGSGKTRVLIERTKRLVNDGADPLRMAVITFTNDAAKELLKRTTHKFGFCGTLHSFTLKMLRTHGHIIGLQSNISVIDKKMQEELIDTIKAEQGCKSLSRKAIRIGLGVGPFDLIDLSQTGQPLNKAETVALAYYHHIIKHSILDYDSILQFGIELFRRLDSDCVEYDYLFVDEYQDSSFEDDAIYDALPIKNKFFVGDADQSIYSFRGATIGNILAKQESCSYGDEKAESFFLQQNYRSDRFITEAAQRLIEHNENRIDKKTISVSEDDGKVYCAKFEHEDEEAEYIAREIKKLPDHNEVAIIVRYNHTANYFREFLERKKIEVMRPKIDEKPEGWDEALLFMSLLCNPNNNEIAHRWLVHASGKRKADSARLQAMKQFKTINETTLHIGRMEDPGELLKTLTSHGIRAGSVRRIGNTLDSIGDMNMADLFTALVEVPEYNLEGSGVTVCTIHGAKGREWDHVFLPAFEEGHSPNTSSKADLQEERRMAYVAITRARHYLAITHSKTRSKAWGQGEEQRQRSRFIDEAGLI